MKGFLRLSLSSLGILFLVCIALFLWEEVTGPGGTDVTRLAEGSIQKKQNSKHQHHSTNLTALLAGGEIVAFNPTDNNVTIGVDVTIPDTSNSQHNVPTIFTTTSAAVGLGASLHYNTSSASSNSAAVVRPRITILACLAGNTCNWLLIIAKAKSVQLRLEKLGIDSEIQYYSRWKQGRCKTCMRDIKSCFPIISGLVETITWTKTRPYARSASSNRQTWFQQHNLTVPTALQLMYTAGGTSSSREREYKGLQSLQRVLQQHSPALSGTISQPFWPINGFADAYDYNEFYEELRSYLHFDSEKCCNLKPGPDTSVLHFRGFSAEETPEKSKANGRQELSPRQIATVLFNSSGTDGGPPKEVAILSRLGDASALIQEMIGNFTVATNVTFIHQSAPTEDFCYLLHSRKELVGIGYSTYFRVAGFLAVHEPTVRTYCLDSNKDNCTYFEFPTNASLQARYKMETYSGDRS